MIFLVSEMQSILIVFGALKIATRIQPDPEHQGV
jgi:hypothetical protein